jgi:hypothetical protein
VGKKRSQVSMTGYIHMSLDSLVWVKGTLGEIRDIGVVEAVRIAVDMAPLRDLEGISFFWLWTVAERVGVDKMKVKEEARDVLTSMLEDWV